MTKYRWTPNGLENQDTGDIEPFRHDAPVVLPRIHTGDEQEPLLSMADGKMYTSKAKMRESYKPGGNPQGATFVEIGDDQSYKKQAQANRKPDENLIREATERAFADLNAGRLGE